MYLSISVPKFCAIFEFHALYHLISLFLSQDGSKETPIPLKGFKMEFMFEFVKFVRLQVV